MKILIFNLLDLIHFGNRIHTGGGGIVFLIRKNYNYTEIKNLFNDNPFAELCGIEITNLRNSVSIIACYKTPKIHLNDKEWCFIVSNIKSKHRCIFLGDFNSHNEAWNCADTDSDGVSLLEQTEKLNLFLHNSNTHTRFNVATNYKSNIDLIFSTIDIAHLLMVKVSDDSRGSDHFIIHIEYDTEKTVYNKLSFKIQSQRTN